jgi:hypothetical protein
MMEKPTALKFADATLEQLNDIFGLARDFEFSLPAYQNWLAEAEKMKISDFETSNLKAIQPPLLRGVGGWNEVELESKFIAPLFNFAAIDDGTIGYFMERPLAAELQGVRLFGTADGLIAKGVEDPKLPYFCMQEFKRSQDHKGRANGQALAAMLAAQTLNENKLPIYGLYVIGSAWNFMVLEGKKYVISGTYAADRHDLTDIFKMLKALKILIYKNIELEK